MAYATRSADEFTVAPVVLLFTGSIQARAVPGAGPCLSRGGYRPIFYAGALRHLGECDCGSRLRRISCVSPVSINAAFLGLNQVVLRNRRRAAPLVPRPPGSARISPTTRCPGALPRRFEQTLALAAGLAGPGRASIQPRDGFVNWSRVACDAVPRLHAQPESAPPSDLFYRAAGAEA